MICETCNGPIELTPNDNGGLPARLVHLNGALGHDPLPPFDVAEFDRLATQLRLFAGGYRSLGLTAVDAAGWANRGFMPNEAAPWLAEGHTSERASFWANKYTVSPADARERDGR